MGLGFLVLSVALNGGIYIYKYFISGEFENLVIGLILVGIYGLLGYGIFKMSKAAATITLILIVGLWLVDIITSEKVSGVPFLFMWCLFQTNRAIYWYRGKREIAEIPVPIINKCPECGEEYNERDYDAGQTEWACAKCKTILPRA